MRLDWRGDPFTNMSDLTLVVYDGSGSGNRSGDGSGGGSSRGTSYFLHTLLLVYGGRKSGFVVEQLKQQQQLQQKGKKNSRGNGNYNNSKDNCKDATIEIYIPPLAARLMPTFLDYIYGITATLQFTTSNAPPLRYLANRFDTRDLHREISHKFIPRDLELHTAPSYCMAADELKDFELRDRALTILAERMDKLTNLNLLREMSPRLMRSLIQCDKLNCGTGVSGSGSGGVSVGSGGSNHNSSTLLSEKVAQWLRCRDGDPMDAISSSRTKSNSTNGHKGSSIGKGISSKPPPPPPPPPLSQLIPLTDEDFYWLTHVQKMPQISYSEALFYLNYGSTHFPQVMNEIGSGSLKSRCLSAISGSQWSMDTFIPHCLEGQLHHHDCSSSQEHSQNSNDNEQEQQQQQSSSSLELQYSNLPLEMKVQLLEASLIGAKKLMTEKDTHFKNRGGREKDLQLSEDIMFKKLKESHNSSSSSSSSSPVKTMKVIFLGSGIPSANGIYIYNSAASASDDTQNNNNNNNNNTTRIVYEKEAVWNQQHVTFLLYPATTGQYYTQYKLAVRQKNSHQTMILYNSPTVMGMASSSGGASSSSSSPFLGGRQGSSNDGDGGMIPEKGWQVEGEGVHPPPQFVGRVEQPATATNSITSAAASMSSRNRQNYYNKENKLTHSV